MKRGYLPCPACGNPTKKETFSEFYIKEFYKKNILGKIESLSRIQLKEISYYLYDRLEKANNNEFDDD